MNVILREQHRHLLRFDPGEEVIEALAAFCTEHGIAGGWFWGLGAAGEATLAYYNLDTKEYEDNVFHERLEITSLTGNIARKKNEVILHAHGCLSGSDLKTYSGHVTRLVVSGTCEILLEAFNQPLERGRDAQTGLNILQ